MLDSGAFNVFFQKLLDLRSHNCPKEITEDHIQGVSLPGWPKRERSFIYCRISSFSLVKGSQSLQLWRMASPAVENEALHSLPPDARAALRAFKTFEERWTGSNFSGKRHMNLESGQTGWVAALFGCWNHWFTENQTCGKNLSSTCQTWTLVGLVCFWSWSCDGPD